MAEEPTMVIVGRADLSLSKGKFAAQAAHAAVKCALTAKRTDPRILDKWNESGALPATYMVTMGGSNTSDMQRITVATSGPTTMKLADPRRVLR